MDDYPITQYETLPLEPRLSSQRRLDRDKGDFTDRIELNITARSRR
jgi:hypothetical protein